MEQTKQDKRVDTLAVGDVFESHNTRVLVLEKPRTGVETAGPLAGRACLLVRGRRLDTLKEGDVIFGPEASVIMVQERDTLLPEHAPTPKLPQQHGSTRPKDWAV